MQQQQFTQRIVLGAICLIGFGTNKQKPEKMFISQAPRLSQRRCAGEIKIGTLLRVRHYNKRILRCERSRGVPGRPTCPMCELHTHICYIYSLKGIRRAMEACRILDYQGERPRTVKYVKQNIHGWLSIVNTLTSVVTIFRKTKKSCYPCERNMRPVSSPPLPAAQRPGRDQPRGPWAHPW